MSHRQQVRYCKRIKSAFPDKFKGKKVLDCGSLDINGNNRYLFSECEYTGADIGAGRNVDIISLIHEIEGDDGSYDFIVSTECFEHDMHYKESLKNITRLLKSGGMFLFTCATTGRKEHGTKRSNPADAPLLTGEWSDYYKNLTEEDIREAIDVDDIFSDYKFEIEVCKLMGLNFYGIKK